MELRPMEDIDPVMLDKLMRIPSGWQDKVLVYLNNLFSAKQSSYYIEQNSNENFFDPSSGYLDDFLSSVFHYAQINNAWTPIPNSTPNPNPDENIAGINLNTLLLLGIGIAGIKMLSSKKKSG